MKLEKENHHKKPSILNFTVNKVAWWASKYGEDTGMYSLLMALLLPKLLLGSIIVM